MRRTTLTMTDQKTDKAAPTSSRSVLVIEDNADSAEVLRTYLGLFGHRVAVFSNVADGVEAAKAQTPDVVVCDLNLPGGLTGFDAAEEIRKVTALGKTLLVALSGNGEPENMEKAKKAGFDIYMTKPADFDALVDLIGDYDGG